MFFFCETRTPKLATQIMNICVLLMNTLFFRGSGAPLESFGAGSGTGEAKEEEKRRKPHPFGRSFWQLSRNFAGVFCSAFSGALVFRTLGGLGAQRCPKGRFGEVISMTFWG